MRLLYLTLLAALFLTGCGGPKFVPVSGVIKVDGQPYGNAVISFQPIGSPENPDPGRGSTAETDKDGHFALECAGVPGAVVGKHRVRIMTRGTPQGQDPTKVAGDGAPAARPVDPIPPEWNANSTQEFEVPAKGTDQANFDILTKK